MSTSIVPKTRGVEYRLVEEYPGYAVGDDGSIWSKHRRGHPGGIGDEWCKLIPSVDRDGYRKIELRNGWQTKRFGVAALVLIAFIGSRPKGMLATHWNGSRNDDRLENLRWATAKENSADKKRHGTNRATFGENHPFAKLNNEIVVQIRSKAARGVSTREICREFQLTRTQVRRIVNRQRWSHL